MTTREERTEKRVNEMAQGLVIVETEIKNDREHLGRLDESVKDLDEKTEIIQNMVIEDRIERKTFIKTITVIWTVGFTLASIVISAIAVYISKQIS